MQTKSQIDVKKFKFESVDPPLTRANKYKGIVEFSRKAGDNSYPEFLISLIPQSTTHSSFVEFTVNAILGGGFKFEDTQVQEWFDNWNNQEIEATQLELMANDLAVFNGTYLETNWSKESVSLVEKRGTGLQVTDNELTNLKATFSHTPFPMWRSGLPNDANDVEYYVYSNNWQKTRNQSDRVQVGAFNPDNIAEEHTQVLFTFRPNHNSSVYPVPYYLSGIYHILCEGQLAQINYNTLVNNFTPAGMFVIPQLAGGETAKKKLNEQFEDAYTGANNAGQIILFQVPNGEDVLKPEFIPITTSDNPDMRVTMANEFAQRIASAWGSPSTSIVGQLGNTGFSSEANEMVAAFGIYQEKTIDYYQRYLERIINNYVMKYSPYPESKGSIEKMNFKDILGVFVDNNTNDIL